MISGGLSSSDSSPTHQDSCSHTLTQDLSPSHPSYSTLNTQPSSTIGSFQSTVQPTHPFPHPTKSTPQLTSSSPAAAAAAATATTVPAIVSTQPSSSSSAPSSSQSLSSSSEQPSSENKQDSSVIMREEAVVRQPTHRGDGVELCWQDTLVSSAEVIAEGAVPVVEKELSFQNVEHTAASAETSRGVENSSEYTEETRKCLDRGVVGNEGKYWETERGSAGGSGSDEGNTGGLEVSSGSIEESLISSEGTEGGGGGTEGSVGGVALDVSVESGGSSDTITASLDSSQLTW